MFDVELAQKSVAKIKKAEYSLEGLTYDERENLVNMIDDWWQQQGWDIEELQNTYQGH